MTPAEFDAALAALGWSARYLAGLLGCNRTLPLAWSSGRATVPVPVAAWLRALGAAHERLPLPDWRTRSAA